MALGFRKFISEVLYGISLVIQARIEWQVLVFASLTGWLEAIVFIKLIDKTLQAHSVRRPQYNEYTIDNWL